MMADYVVSTTRDFAFTHFLEMSDAEFAKELGIIFVVYEMYRNNEMVDNLSFECVEEIYEIAKDALVRRCLYDNNVSIQPMGRL